MTLPRSVADVLARHVRFEVECIDRMYLNDSAAGNGPVRRSSNLTPEQRSLRARLAVYVRWAKQDPVEGTAAARRAFLARFEREVDPEGTLPEPERLRRAESARRAYFTRLAYRSSLVRSARSRAMRKTAQRDGPPPGDDPRDGGPPQRRAG
jgi:hypothetical protein